MVKTTKADVMGKRKKSATFDKKTFKEIEKQFALEMFIPRQVADVLGKATKDRVQKNLATYWGFPDHALDPTFLDVIARQPKFGIEAFSLHPSDAAGRTASLEVSPRMGLVFPTQRVRSTSSRPLGAVPDWLPCRSARCLLHAAARSAVAG